MTRRYILYLVKLKIRAYLKFIKSMTKLFFIVYIIGSIALTIISLYLSCWNIIQYILWIFISLVTSLFLILKFHHEDLDTKYIVDV